LRRLPSSCKFDEFLDQALKDRLVAGLRHEIMVRKLLSETSALSFDSACKMVVDMDTVRKNTAVMHERVEVEKSQGAIIQMAILQKQKPINESHSKKE